MDLIKLIEEICLYLFQTAAPIVIGANLGITASNKLKLYTTSKYTGEIILEIPSSPAIDKKEIDYKTLGILIPLIQKLKDYTTEENLKALYKSLQTLKIEKKPIFLSVVCGEGYYTIDNTLKYSLFFLLPHGLVHLASSSYDKERDVIFSGFCQVKGKYKFAVGLNEGYTELITSKIYNKNCKPNNYKKQAKIARLLEYFFNDPKEMEALYFNHDLPGLINHLEYYAKREDIIKFINDLDVIYNYRQAPASPIAVYSSIKAQLTLYDWFVAKDRSLFKSFEFKELLCEDVIVAQIIKQRKNSPCREIKYSDLKQLCKN